MHYLKRQTRENNDEGVSPVVGVMLMLVVTIIIAAVVSAFSGGLMGTSNNQKTPTLAMDVKIANTGNVVDSGFSAKVLSISEPTATKNLKIATSWVTTMRDNTANTSGIPLPAANGAAFAGGASTDIGNTTTIPYGAPYGFGPGISGDGTITAPYNKNQYFGNYTLTQGTGLVAEPAAGYSGYGYVANSEIKTILGIGWEQLRPGDIVTVRVIYTPTGKAIFQKDVIVTGA